MKPFKNIPVYFLIFISFAASMLMGCSGGGGGGGSDDSNIPDGFAPKALTAGMVFDLTGSMEYYPTGSDVYYYGDVEKRITVTSPTSGTVDSTAYITYTSTTGLTYERRNANVARLTANNYPYNTNSTISNVGNVEVRLSFSSATAGTFVELGKDGLAYGGSGNFTLTLP